MRLRGIVLLLAVADVSPASEDGSTDHEPTTDGHEQGLVDSGEVAQSAEATEEAEAEDDAEGAENDVNEQGHDRDWETRQCP